MMQGVMQGAMSTPDSRYLSNGGVVLQHFAQQLWVVEHDLHHGVAAHLAHHVAHLLGVVWETTHGEATGPRKAP